MGQSEMAAAVARLQDRSVVLLDVEAAHSLSASAQTASAGRHFLARAGVIAGPGLTLAEVYPTAQFIQIRAAWNPQDKLLWIGSFQLAKGEVRPYDIAVVVAVPGPVEQAVTECNWAA
jgi:hypothetical protein